ncbi:MAG: phosphatidylglycerophosphatase A [Elusimicrobiota bacterium]
MKKTFDKLSVFLSTGLYLSFLPSVLIRKFSSPTMSQALSSKKWTGAGIIGSIQGVLTVLFLPEHFSNSWFWLLVGLFISIILSDRAEKVLGSHDDSRIVIDEWIGMIIALKGLGLPLWIPAFILFRFFDVWKGPWGKYFQKWPGGLGIVSDDVAAGILTNFILVTFSQFF